MADDLRKKADEIIDEIRQEARAEVSPAKVAKPIGLRSKLANFFTVSGVIQILFSLERSSITDPMVFIIFIFISV